MQRARHYLRNTLLIVGVVVIGETAAALAQAETRSPASLLGGAESLTHQGAGLRIERSNIVTEFTGQLTRFLGDCPGNEWTGSATQDNVRFFSYATPPGNDLRVELMNLTSGESFKRKYTQEGYGSSDFEVFKLGRAAGRQNIEYIIYNKATEAIIEKGNFSYDLITQDKTIRRDGEWRSELFCATDENIAMKDCEQIGGRQRLYCEGRKTETVRGTSLQPRRPVSQPTPAS